MMGNFLLPLANAENYPAAKVNMLPRQRANAGRNQRELPKQIVAVEYMATARGLLSVIAYGFKNKKILIPSYHCPAMVEPFLFHQCNIEFYKVNQQLEFDSNELETKMLTADMVVGVRYFGFSSKMAELKSLAVKTNTFMVEDLAHAAFAKQVYGDAAVTSLKKFYPVEAGAELFIANPNWLEDCKRAIVKLRVSKFDLIYTRVLAKCRRKSTYGEFRYFNPIFSHSDLPFSNRFLLNHYNHQQCADIRRANYETLANAFRNLSFAQALFPKLEPDAVPYVFPLLIKDKKYFSLMRQAGIPLYRWEEMVNTNCSVSLTFRELLVQLPCHQDLSSADLDWIIETILNIDQQDKLMRS